LSVVEVINNGLDRFQGTVHFKVTADEKGARLAGVLEDAKRMSKRTTAYHFELLVN